MKRPPRHRQALFTSPLVLIMCISSDFRFSDSPTDHSADKTDNQTLVSLTFTRGKKDKA